MPDIDWITGETARLHTTVSVGIDATLTDPANLRLKIKRPGEQATTHLLDELTRTGTGEYYYEVTLTCHGTWYYRWESEGAASEGHINVQPSRLYP